MSSFSETEINTISAYSVVTMIVSLSGFLSVAYFTNRNASMASANKLLAFLGILFAATGTFTHLYSELALKIMLHKQIHSCFPESSAINLNFVSVYFGILVSRLCWLTDIYGVRRGPPSHHKLMDITKTESATHISDVYLRNHAYRKLSLWWAIFSATLIVISVLAFYVYKLCSPYHVVSISVGMINCLSSCGILWTIYKLKGTSNPMFQVKKYSRYSCYTMFLVYVLLGTIFEIQVLIFSSAKSLDEMVEIIDNAPLYGILSHASVITCIAAFAFITSIHCKLTVLELSNPGRIKPTMISPCATDKYLGIIMLKENQMLFTDVLRSKFFRERFIKHMQLEFCAENMQFWIEAYDYACTFDFKKSYAQKLNGARLIYNKYIKDGSQYELNLSSAIKSRITSLLQSKTTRSTMFDRALKDVFYIMKNDSFPRFRKKREFDSLLAIVYDDQRAWDFDIDLKLLKRCLKS